MKIYKKKNKIYDNLLDLRGIRCPDSILFLRKKIRTINKNEIILIISDDISTQRDFPIFCNFMGHHLIETSIQYLPYRYLLEKGNKKNI